MTCGGGAQQSRTLNPQDAWSRPRAFTPVAHVPPAALARRRPQSEQTESLQKEVDELEQVAVGIRQLEQQKASLAARAARLPQLQDELFALGTQAAAAEDMCAQVEALRAKLQVRALGLAGRMRVAGGDGARSVRPAPAHRGDVALEALRVEHACARAMCACTW